MHRISLQAEDKKKKKKLNKMEEDKEYNVKLLMMCLKMCGGAGLPEGSVGYVLRDCTIPRETAEEEEPQFFYGYNSGDSCITGEISLKKQKKK